MEQSSASTFFHLVFHLVLVALAAEGLEMYTTDGAIAERAVGGNTTLECKFEVGPGDVGSLEIKWFLRSVRDPADRAALLMYADGRIFDGYDEPQRGRIHFRAPDPGGGDATAGLVRLTPTDSGVYCCQVKKAKAIRKVKTVLRVLEKPSKLKCYSTEGEADPGKLTKVLHCGSGGGEQPIRYQWSRLPPRTPMSDSAAEDPTAGTLTLPDAGERDAGTYLCTAINRVGREVCFVEVHVPRPPRLAETLAAAVGTVAAIALISALSYSMVAWRRRKGQEEAPVEVLENAENTVVLENGPVRSLRPFARLGRPNAQTTTM